VQMLRSALKEGGKLSHLGSLAHPVQLPNETFVTIRQVFWSCLCSQPVALMPQDWCGVVYEVCSGRKADLCRAPASAACCTGRVQS